MEGRFEVRREKSLAGKEEFKNACEESSRGQMCTVQGRRKRDLVMTSGRLASMGESYDVWNEGR